MLIYFEDCKRTYTLHMYEWNGANWSQDISEEVLPPSSFKYKGSKVYVHSCMADVYDYIVDWSRQGLDTGKETGNSGGQFRFAKFEVVKEVTP